jgi:hypothetical protein
MHRNSQCSRTTRTFLRKKLFFPKEGREANLWLRWLYPLFWPLFHPLFYPLFYLLKPSVVPEGWVGSHE